jgi:hypothetical protein
MGHIEYYRGRPIKSDFSGFEVSAARYDSGNPVQPLAAVVARLKGADAKVGDATFLSLHIQKIIKNKNKILV